MATTGELIKKYRKEKKMTQQELAEIIHRKETTIRKYENGDIQPPTDMLKKIAKALGISVTKLIDIDATMSEVKRAVAAFAEEWETDDVEHLEKIADILDNLKKLNKAGTFEADHQIDLLNRVPEYKRNQNN